MATTANSGWVGELDVSKVERVVKIDVLGLRTARIQIRPRFGADFAAWVGTVKQGLATDPQPQASAVTLTAAAPITGEINTESIVTLFVETTTAGTSGIVDIHMDGKDF